MKTDRDSPDREHSDTGGKDSPPESKKQDNERFFAVAAEDVLAHFSVRRDQGLNETEVEERRQRYGPNELEEEARRAPLHILVDQFKSVVILILVAAAVVALATARWPEAAALVVVTLVNTAIGFVTEYKAVRSMEALRRLGEQTAVVRRRGREKEVPVRELVPGDIVILSDEDLVPADMRLLDSGEVRVNEAALTGESIPVSKSAKPTDPGARLHERTSMLYKGTSIEEGDAEGVVTAVGTATELGRIAELTAAAERKQTPLQRRLDHLGRRLAWITLGIAAAVGTAGLAVGRDPVVMVETAIALGVAAVPEGLPIVATIALARGMWLMSRHNALVNRLTAVETLGATSVIFTDKTGTLTENAMSVRNLVTPQTSRELGRSGSERDDAAGNPSLERLLAIGVLCSNVREAEEGGDLQGDPTEVALVEAAGRLGVNRQERLERLPEVREVPFDSETMLMATVHRDDGERENSFYVAVKGAPHRVLEICDRIVTEDGEAELSPDQRDVWGERADELAAGGLRLLACCDKRTADEAEEVYRNLRFAGLVAFEDPPREDVREAIGQCREGGIRVVMVTGDRPDTGAAVGEQVGLETREEPFHGEDLRNLDELSEADRERIRTASVFARVTPEQKFNLVRFYQQSGHITAMTGDGINDAPALKQADIGVAMGVRGTDAARQVADMVLRDDRFATIVRAVREGRIIFANIRKSVLFMLCTNIAEVLVVALASLTLLPIPLKPLQILYLNVLTDVFPALALGVGLGSADVMKRPPRPAREAVLTPHHWRFIGLWSVIIGAHVLAALLICLYGLGFSEKRAVTVSFLTLAGAKLWFVLNLRDRGTPLWRNDVTVNRWMWGAWLLCAALLLAAVYAGPLSLVLQTAAPGAAGWGLIVGLSALPALIGVFVPGVQFYTTADRSHDPS